MSCRLWLIGGTQESRSLVEGILTSTMLAGRELSSCPLLVSVTTETARQLYPETTALVVWVGKLTPQQGDLFIMTHQIGAILDVSHPFAVDISRLAIALSQRHRLPYLRYERADLNTLESAHWQDTRGRPGNVVLVQLTELFTGGYLRGERTLLTVGYRQLSSCKGWQSSGTLFARILPSPVALTAALAAGFTSDRIIALRPPVSPALEKALWQQWHITQVVTKASGQAGGEDRKQAIAAELGIRLLRVMRPFVPYPAQTACLDTAIDFVLQFQQQQVEC